MTIIDSNNSKNIKILIQTHTSFSNSNSQRIRCPHPTHASFSYLGVPGRYEKRVCIRWGHRTLAIRVGKRRVDLY